MKPTYFDLSVRDLKQARQFFEKVLDWRFEKFPMPDEYYRIQAGPASEPGVDGGIGAIEGAPLAGGRPTTQITMPVARLAAVTARVRANGGTVLEDRIAIPGIGWHATCAEPGGLAFGLIEADPNAK